MVVKGLLYPKLCSQESVDATFLWVSSIAALLLSSFQPATKNFMKLPAVGSLMKFFETTVAGWHKDTYVYLKMTTSQPRISLQHYVQLVLSVYTLSRQAACGLWQYLHACLFLYNN